MNYLANGKQDGASTSNLKSKEISWTEPNSMEKFNWLLHLQHVRGETEACKTLIKEGIATSKGKNEYVYFKEGIILREEGKIQEALESFQICHKLNSTSVINIKEIAKCLYLLRRFRLSLEAYLEAEKASHKADWEICHNIGQCLLRLGDTSKAKDYARKAVKLGRQEISYSLLIKILTSEGDFLGAANVCNAGLESCPDSVSMLTESGLLYLKVGQTQLAFERLTSALALSPSNYEALLGVGCITQFHEEYDVALSKYKIAVQSQPDSVALWNNIGMCFYSKQKLIAAVSCLKRALWFSPLNWRILLNLGLVHLSTHQPASAFNFLCAAVNLKPDMAISFMILGCVLLELNDAENALKAFQQAFHLSPDDPSVNLNTTLCLLKNDMIIEARDLFMKFKSLWEQQEGRMSKEMLALGNYLESRINQDNTINDSDLGSGGNQEDSKTIGENLKDSAEENPTQETRILLGPDEV